LLPVIGPFRSIKKKNQKKKKNTKTNKKIAKKRADYWSSSFCLRGIFLADPEGNYHMGRATV